MKDSERFTQALRLVAPGTELRQGLENILRAGTGALIVVGDSVEVMELAEGGFSIDSPFRPAALYELAKMDGAIILTGDVGRILRANVHLLPGAAIPSQETGTRHRVAERVARQTGTLVIAISQRRGVITLYQGPQKYVLPETRIVITRANQALQTLEKFGQVLRHLLHELSLAELEGTVSLGDVARVLRPAVMVRRVSEELERLLEELGVEGRLIQLQRDELLAGLGEEASLLVRDYMAGASERAPEQVWRNLAQGAAEELPDLMSIIRALGASASLGALDQPVVPRGYRLLHKLPRLPMAVIENLMQKFGTLPAVLGASVTELDGVEGIGEVRARAIREGLRRLGEQIRMEGRI